MREKCPKWSFFWSVFSCIRTEYRDLLSKSPYSVRIQENTDQKKFVFGDFSRSVHFSDFVVSPQTFRLANY